MNLHAHRKLERPRCDPRALLSLEGIKTDVDVAPPSSEFGGHHVVESKRRIVAEGGAYKAYPQYPTQSALMHAPMQAPSKYPASTGSAAPGNPKETHERKEDHLSRLQIC
jgi:hypothetical protein